MSCDLCKKPYPYKFIMGNTVIELIQIPKPPEKYIILEGLCKDKNSSKWLHVISLNNKNSITLGRGNDCELKMTDISVSRVHASIKLIGENYFLEDKQSKFGTLVQIKRPLALDNDFDVSIQAGRTLMSFSLKKPWSIIPACFRPSSTPFNLFSSPFTPGVLPLLPYNTGIPISINDIDELLFRVGLCTKKKDEKYGFNDNLMFEHGQLGMNSSLEDENEEILPVQEIVVASTPSHAPNEQIEDKEIRERRNHSVY